MKCGFANSENPLLDPFFLQPLVCQIWRKREKRGKTSLLAAVDGDYICLPNFMADIANKYPDNVAGKYYVDNQCIDCDLCRETAPNNFKRNEDGGFSFVCKQPGSPEEEAQCKEAQEGCPVEAIGDNG
jgi:ferredoxin